MFYADLHLHSKYSRATSQDADLEHMAIWARRKGVSVLGTGDFTHPSWISQIRDKLLPAEPGLFRLRDDLQREVDRQVDPSCRGVTRFMLQVEIATIYKRGERTRKVHHLIYVPGLAEAERLIERLTKIGNLRSDGRPILGLDSRDLLEIALECGGGAFLIPAHIWTPWFAVLGSKSGFESVGECYADLAGEIFALETGLSSNPPMNWRLSQLDRFALVSNSDAHSPGRIGREACVFHVELDFFAMRRALQTRQGYGGTVEFFPEEGKYHLDGHRKCEVRLPPAETRRMGGLCPACGKALTVGVLNRVDALADRPEGFVPHGADACRHFVPLIEILAEIHGVAGKSKRVEETYARLLSAWGPELLILAELPLEELRRSGDRLLAEAIQRMREGRVRCEAGYDGQYGTVRLFEEGELRHPGSRGLLGDLAEESEQGPVGEARGAAIEQLPRGETAHGPCAAGGPDGGLLMEAGQGCGCPPDEGGRCAGPKSAGRAGAENQQEGPLRPEAPGRPSAASRLSRVAPHDPGGPLLQGLDEQQRAAVQMTHGPLLVIAGPGTGKTRVLTHRAAYLVERGIVAPEQCLLITFSRRAAGEMAQRLDQLLPGIGTRLPVFTFHALGLAIARERAERLGWKRSFRVADEAERRQLLMEALRLSPAKADRLLARLAQAKRAGTIGDLRGEERETWQAYQALLAQRSLVDFDDLIVRPCELLESDASLASEYRRRWPWLSVDEFQDIDPRQYALVRQLAPPDGNVCAIGDPDQSIYGFRGSDPRLFRRFMEDYPSARELHLATNYRSSPAIIAAGFQAIAPSSLCRSRRPNAASQQAELVDLHTCPTDKAEAEFIVQAIERLIGGATFFSLDSGRVDGHEGEPLAFSDFAVLYRTDAQADVLAEALGRSGIPFQKKSHSGLADEPARRAIIDALCQMLESSGPAQGTLRELLAQAARGVQLPAEVAAAAFRDLASAAERCEGDPYRFLGEVTLESDADTWDPRADRVSLLTLHAAKGLEFPVVFLAGCEDGVLPLRWGQGSEVELDEERRLLFVGITRARWRLFLSHARRRFWRGKVRDMQPSPFLREIQEKLLRRSASSGQRRKAPASNQLQLF